MVDELTERLEKVTKDRNDSAKVDMLYHGLIKLILLTWNIILLD